MQPTKKTTPKTQMPTNANQGNACPSTVALNNSLACVKGSRYKAALATSGYWFSEKKVPQRKVIGRITNVLKVLMP
jgi:hypothetical protein